MFEFVMSFLKTSAPPIAPAFISGCAILISAAISGYFVNKTSSQARDVARRSQLENQILTSLSKMLELEDTHLVSVDNKRLFQTCQFLIDPKSKEGLGLKLHLENFLENTGDDLAVWRVDLVEKASSYFNRR